MQFPDFTKKKDAPRKVLTGGQGESSGDARLLRSQDRRRVKGLWAARVLLEQRSPIRFGHWIDLNAWIVGHLLDGKKLYVVSASEESAKEVMRSISEQFGAGRDIEMLEVEEHGSDR